MIQDRLQRDNRESSAVAQDLETVDSLNTLRHEVESIGNQVREKQETIHALLESHGLPERQQTTLMKLCSLHAEFLSLSAVQSRLAAFEKPQNTMRDGLMRDPLRADDPMRGGGARNWGPPQPNNPMHPEYFGEPDNDAFQPPQGPGGNYLPQFPGQYGGGGGGGVGGPMRNFPPGYNPDFERDRTPLGGMGGPFGPPGGGGFGGGGPRGPRGPGGRGDPFNPNPQGGAGFGQPRYM